MSEEKKTEEEPKEENLETETVEAVEVEAEESEPDAAAKEEATDSKGAENTDPVTLSAEDYKALQGQADKAAENWDRLVRLNAEFDNYKKRAARDRTEAIKYANETLLETLIPTLDNFEMAMMAVDSATAETIDSLKQGITMVHKQLRDAIKEAGMEEIDASAQTFDPAWHEAVSQQETDEVPEGQVLQQIRKGYKLKDRLVRPANVVVAKAKSDSDAE